jgi:hypothetical protein
MTSLSIPQRTIAGTLELEPKKRKPVSGEQSPSKKASERGSGTIGSGSAPVLNSMLDRGSPFVRAPEGRNARSG